MIQKEQNRAGRSGTLMKSVYHSLKEDICNGVIKTGELLSEAQLAERLSVSRTPVREALAALVDSALTIPDTHPMFLPSLEVIPMQLFAYYVALMRGCDIDKPRNLAKSVTVE